MKLDELAHQMSEALDFIEVAITAMNAEDKAGPELAVLEHGVRELRKIHGELERAT